MAGLDQKEGNIEMFSQYPSEAKLHDFWVDKLEYLKIVCRMKPEVESTKWQLFTQR